MRHFRRVSLVSGIVFGVLVLAPAESQVPNPESHAAIEYRLSLPEPERRWMQVEVVFPGVGASPLQVRMSRSSPGRYALHEFAKNVFDLRVTNGEGRLLAPARANAHQWEVSGHDGTVRVTYKVHGDRLDGTYLAIDATHAHVNMPAALMWARGLDERPVRVRFEQPPGGSWRVATQLYPSDDPLLFTAPNLQYLMDSPAEFSGFSLRTFTVPRPAPSSAGRGSSEGRGAAPTFRIALHHDGVEAGVDRFAADVEKIVREAVGVFGEFPPYETGTYTFLADYLPYAHGDGMEHRNSAVLTAAWSLRDEGGRAWPLGTVAHEFFHGWNVERIRPRSLEPFNFEEANVSGELWLAEGVTSYYEALIMQRSGLATLSETTTAFANWINTVQHSPGRRRGSAVDMSRLAPFVDAARPVDRTNFENTYISYYTWGAAIGLALDLTLRDRPGGAVTLDDYMRALWQTYGKLGGRTPGLVDRPYTLRDARQVLAAVSGDPAFADHFFERYIEGREVADYARLLEPAGLVLRRRAAAPVALGDDPQPELVPVEATGQHLTEAQRRFRGAWLGSRAVTRDEDMCLARIPARS